MEVSSFVYKNKLHGSNVAPFGYCDSKQNKVETAQRSRTPKGENDAVMSKEISSKGRGMNRIRKVESSPSTLSASQSVRLESETATHQRSASEPSASKNESSSSSNQLVTEVHIPKINHVLLQNPSESSVTTDPRTTKSASVMFEASDVTWGEAGTGSNSNFYDSVISPIHTAPAKMAKMLRKQSLEKQLRKIQKADTSKELEATIPVKSMSCRMNISIEDTEKIKRKHGPGQPLPIKSNLRMQGKQKARRRVSFVPEPYLQLKRFESRPPRMTWTVTVIQPYNASEGALRPGF